MILAVATSSCDDTVMVVEPTPTAETVPLVRPTVAMLGSADDHSTTVGTTRFSELTAMAERYATSPSSKVALFGVMEIATAGSGSGSIGSVARHDGTVAAAMTANSHIEGRYSRAERNRLYMVHLQMLGRYSGAVPCLFLPCVPAVPGIRVT